VHYQKLQEEERKYLIVSRSKSKSKQKLQNRYVRNPNPLCARAPYDYAVVVAKFTVASLGPLDRAF